MLVNSTQLFKELELGQWKPIYLLIDNEPFQSSEIQSRLKSYFIRDEDAGVFNYDSFDGENLNADSFFSSLETLPGLFDVGGLPRFIVVSHFEKIPSILLEKLESYFENPSDSTCLLLLSQKADKRKAWYKQVDRLGYVVELAEPYEREWPRWRSYFEKKTEKKIDPRAWERLVEMGGRTLSLVWREVEKIATYVGERNSIEYADIEQFGVGMGEVDVFSFIEDVVFRKTLSSFQKYHHLIQLGENEVKLTALLIRQFRLIEQCKRLMSDGKTVPKVLATELGVHPFFVTKIMDQASVHSFMSLNDSFQKLSDCDFHLKVGDGSLYGHFLLPYFSQASSELQSRGKSQ